MLSLLKKHTRKSDSGSYYGLFKCVCGNKKEILLKNVASGSTVSCGCHHKKVSATMCRKRNIDNTDHGLSNSNIYKAYNNMMQRCYNIKNNCYIYYGGRGIRVCDRWKESFVMFMIDMGDKPDIKHTLERVDVNKNYTPSNCIWATMKKQANNKRNTIRITIDGKTKSLKEWCVLKNTIYTTAYSRHRSGKSINKIFN